MTTDTGPPPLAGRILAALILVLPFEPRRPILSLLGLEFTLLELMTATGTLWLAWSVRRRMPHVLRRPPLPVACLAAYAVVHFVSAAFAPAHRGAAAVYSLRVAAAAALAAVVAACAPRDVQRGLRAVVLMGGAVAALAILEGAGVRLLDPALNLFRASPFFFEGSRRASATTESPNLAASLIAHGLIATAGLAALAPRPARYTVLRAVPLSAGLLFTYSRGGLLAAVVGAAIVAATLGHRAGRAPQASLASFLVVLTLFAARDDALRRRLVGYHPPEGARYEPLDGPLVVVPGEERTVSVRVVNTGSNAWRPDTHHVGCLWFYHDHFLDAGCQARLPGSVAPGQSVTLAATARAPAVEGNYHLVWNVMEGTAPFRSFGIPPGLVPVTVSREAVAPSTSGPPTIIAPRSRWWMWELAWRMWIERPIAGFGPDNFRKLRPDVGGWPSANEGSADTAHSVYLEAAASTGTLGLATLLATLTTTLVWAHRALRAAASPEGWSASAVVMGLMAGIATQASVDFLLSFTSEYVFFGFLVGASAALRHRPPSDLSAPTAAA